MEYKEFRVVILDESNIRATLPSTVTRKGHVQMDGLIKRVVNVFHRMLAAGDIKFREELEVFGSLLYTVLFNGEIDSAFKSTYDEIQQQRDTTLRLVLEFEQEAEDLATLPWEYLYYPDKPREKGFRIATRSKLILTRHVPLSAEFGTLKPGEGPLRILIVVSQPKDESIVDADPVMKAMDDLKNRLHEAIEIHQLLQPDRRTFPKEIEKVEPHVLHFIGHGKWDKVHKTGELALVNKDEETVSWISDKDFSDFFQDFKPRLIFLHACEGASSESYEGFRGVALQLVYSKVPAVVAMQYPITNKEAIQFTQKFYECLGEGKPIDVAVQEGRQELGMYLEEQHFSSRAFGSPVVFLQSAEGIVIAETKPTEPTPLGSDKLDCPYPICKGKVRKNATICLTCKRELMNCPTCGNIMAKEIGVCDICQWRYDIKKEGMAAPSEKKAAMRESQLQQTSEPERADVQRKQ